MIDFQRKYGMTTLFITHDLSTVAYVGGTMMTIHNGKIVETGTVKDVQATSVELDDTPASGSNAETVTGVDSIRIPAGGLVTLAPGAYHLTVRGCRHRCGSATRCP